MFRQSLVLFLSIFASPILALDIYLPQGSQLVDEEVRNDAISLPTGRFGLIAKPMQMVSGKIERRAWVLEDSNSAVDLMQQMVMAYERQGFEIFWECETDGCGGFDFRYGIETSPPPEFNVNIGEFYYVDLRKEGHTLTILSSNYLGNTYFQQIWINTPQEPSSDTLTSFQASSPESVATDTERWVLSGVEFDAGGSSPAKVDKDELQRVADRLKDHQDETVYIVGHSDQQGGLEANLNISRSRAQAIRNMLVNDFGVAAAQIKADGVAFLAPIANNATQEGRAQNRRIEAVFLTN